jgi:hypothetical protein
MPVISAPIDLSAIDTTKTAQAMNLQAFTIRSQTKLHAAIVINHRPN